ncbi:hypothetical protein HYQ46_012314 [Verticillium longisporum]|nr:hypothetical protein HYQ46_012314 [Verticillium longisporum]
MEMSWVHCDPVSVRKTEQLTQREFLLPIHSLNMSCGTVGQESRHEWNRNDCSDCVDDWDSLKPCFVNVDVFLTHG